MAMSKLNMLIIRACKSKDPHKRLTTEIQAQAPRLYKPKMQYGCLSHCNES